MKILDLLKPNTTVRYRTPKNSINRYKSTI